MLNGKTWTRLAVIGLLAVQMAQIVIVLHRESLTWDETDHMYAGYKMWKSGDYGLNPEHPPLVKLLATLPVLGEKLWTPPNIPIFFKGEAMVGGGAWLTRNDGGSQRLVFRMRLAAALLAMGLSLTIFLAAREWFGATAALIALTLAVFDPNLLAHSGLVTTDVGSALFFLASIYAFYRYIKKPNWLRLIVIGILTGLLLATKHSGILIAPMVLLLMGWEVAFAPKGSRARLALRLAGAFAFVAMVSVLVLWAFYGFRYAARPVGQQLIPSLAAYSQALTGSQKDLIGWMAHWHLLPESYLMGMVDIRVFAKVFNTYLLDNWYAHGVWWYFPAVIAIKTTIGLLALAILAGFAIVTGRLRKDQGRDNGRALVYLIVPAALYLLVAMMNGLNIGVRHILPLYPLAAILAGAGVAALAARSRGWAWLCAALVAAHVVSALLAFPNPMAYANEAWGGPGNTYRLLTDSNVDWGQQLYQVKAWEDRHPGEECWFAYFARPIVQPETYGVHCHVLPSGFEVSRSGFIGSSIQEPTPPIVHGSVLLSAAEVSGSIWESRELDPYSAFETRKPDEEIDYGVLVYRGDVPLGTTGGLSRALMAFDKLRAHQPQQALAIAEEAVKVAPGALYEEMALGDAAAASGRKEEAHAAYQAAIAAAQKLDPERRAEFASSIEEKIKRL